MNTNETPILEVKELGIDFGGLTAVMKQPPALAAACSEIRAANGSYR